MENSKEIELDFEIDKLTNSIENIITGDSFATEVSLLSKNELKLVTKKIIGYLIGQKNISNLKEIFTN